MPGPIAYTTRFATIADMPEIDGIVNEQIKNSTANFAYDPRTVQEGLDWFNNTMKGNYPILVATTHNEAGVEVVGGYASLGSFRSKAGNQFCAEYSLYIHVDHRRRGLGRRLLTELLAEAKNRGFHTIIGSVTADNKPSIDLAQEFGFRIVGTFKDNGFKFGQWIDNTFLELVL